MGSLCMKQVHCIYSTIISQKSDGCNKMVCWRCNTYFCWLCNTVLDYNKPYEHFQDMDSKCYNMLYYGMPIEDDDDIGDGEDLIVDDENMWRNLALHPDYESEDEDFYEDIVI